MPLSSAGTPSSRAPSAGITSARTPAHGTPSTGTPSSGATGAAAPSTEAIELRREQIDVGVACARRAGGVFAGGSALHLMLLAPAELATVLPSALLLVVSAAIQLSSRRAGPAGARAVLAGLVLGFAALAAFLGPGVQDGDRTVLSCVTMLASMALPAGLLAIGSSPRLVGAAVLAGVPALLLGMAATRGSGRALFVGLSVVVCWVIAVIGARWLASSVERARAGTARLRTAHAAERRSSESEARRRREARLMHDTILATLTLLAHRGEGVPAGTLRAQAEADLALLRRLDRTEPEPPAPAGGDAAPREEDGALPSVLAGSAAAPARSAWRCAGTSATPPPTLPSRPRRSTRSHGRRGSASRTCGATPEPPRPTSPSTRARTRSG